MTIDEQLGFIGMIEVGPDIDRLSIFPVPMGEDMKHGLVRPFALIKVIDIFWESSQVNNTEIAAASGPTVRSGLANVVEPAPYELPGNVGKIDIVTKVLFVCATPGGVAVVVSAAFERGIVVGTIPA